MGIIQPPFSDDEDRFDVTFIKQPPRYELLLTIKGITLLCMLCIRPSSRLTYLEPGFPDEYLLSESDSDYLAVYNDLEAEVCFLSNIYNES